MIRAATRRRLNSFVKIRSRAACESNLCERALEQS